jgi:hypothetical protein
MAVLFNKKMFIVDYNEINLSYWTGAIWWIIYPGYLVTSLSVASLSFASRKFHLTFFKFIKKVVHWFTVPVKFLFFLSWHIRRIFQPRANTSKIKNICILQHFSKFGWLIGKKSCFEFTCIINTILEETYKTCD